eukprot:m.219631 g.219631  ORF g.219631 m.219631 type:complete len:441 (+) comp15584_c1_seq5:79-1401(+)
MSTTDCNEGGAINIPSGGHEEAAAGLDQRQAYAELIEQAVLGPVHKRLADVVWRDHVNVPPKRGRQGDKGYAPTNTVEDIEKLEAARAEWEALADETRVITVRGLSVGEWRPDIGAVAMSTMRGPHYRTVGLHNKAVQTTILLPEEAIFLMDRGVLEVQHDGIPMSIQQAYAWMLPKSDLTEAELVTYLMLRRLGYTVRVHRQDTSGGVCVEPTATEPTAGRASADELSTAGWCDVVSAFTKKFSNRATSELFPWLSSVLSTLEAAWAVKPKDVDTLLRDSDLTTLDQVHARLREVVAHSKASKYPSQARQCLRVSLDVFKLNSSFKKSDPGEPEFRVCVCNFSDAPPTRAEFLQLTRSAAPAVLKIAVVDGGVASFYSMLDLDLPIFADWDEQQTRPSESKRKAMHSSQDKDEISGTPTNKRGRQSAPDASELPRMENI